MHEPGSYFIIAPDTDVYSLEYLIKTLKINKFIFFRRHSEKISDLISKISEIKYLCYPSDYLISVDEEGGMVSRLSHIIGSIPDAMALSKCSTGDVYEVYSALFRAIRQLGFNMDFMPVLDILGKYKNRCISTRSYGYDSETVSRFAGLALQSAEEQGILYCMKHFPGLGRTETDSHLALPVIKGGISKLEKDIGLYRSFLKSHNHRFIMTAHSLYPCLDDSLSTFSGRIVTGFLKKDLKFSGAVVSDDLLMGALDAEMSMEQRALRAFTSGIDLLLVSKADDRFFRMYSAIEKGIRDGTITPDRLGDADSRIRSATMPDTGKFYYDSQASFVPVNILKNIAQILYRNARVKKAMFKDITVYLPGRIMASSPVTDGQDFIKDSVKDLGQVNIIVYHNSIDTDKIDKKGTHIVLSANPCYNDILLESLKTLDSILMGYYVISLGEPQEGSIFDNAEKIIYLSTANETVVMECLKRLIRDIYLIG